MAEMPDISPPMRGVIRPAASGPAGAWPFPRLRGGDPQSPTALYPTNAFSPPMRG